jgi:hypothetical protein
LDEIQTGEDIKEEIYNCCKSSFTFVQVIERPSFVMPENEINWCHEEYNTFKDNHKNSLCPNGTDLIDQSFQFIIPFKWKHTIPIQTPIVYNDWIEHCRRLMRLDNIIEYNDNYLGFQIAMDSIAHSIVEAREAFMEQFWL